MYFNVWKMYDKYLLIKLFKIDATKGCKFDVHESCRA